MVTISLGRLLFLLFDIWLFLRHPNIKKKRKARQTRLQYVLMYIKTHGSESQGQEEADPTRRMSELFTGSTALKIVNALNKPPLKLSLSYQRLSTF